MQSKSKDSRKGSTVWLVTWEWDGEHAKTERKIAAILNRRWSADRVREYVELIYVNSSYSIVERIAYAKDRSFNPYPAKFRYVNGIEYQDRITCGHNPWLFARLVDNLAAAGDPDDEEKVDWTERF